MVPFVYYLWYIFELIFFSTFNILRNFLNNDNNGFVFIADPDTGQKKKQTNKQTN